MIIIHASASECNPLAFSLFFSGPSFFAREVTTWLHDSIELVYDVRCGEAFLTGFFFCHYDDYSVLLLRRDVAYTND